MQLESLTTYFQCKNIPVSLKECIKYLQGLAPDVRSFYSEVCTVTKLIFAIPATNALSETLFSAMHWVKNYLRSTMCQVRLNHVMVLNIYKEELRQISDSEHCKRFFGTFT